MMPDEIIKGHTYEGVDGTRRTVREIPYESPWTVAYTEGKLQRKAPMKEFRAWAVKDITKGKSHEGV
jgi:hypothetical protein